jgi:transposase InsO family protein
LGSRSGDIVRDMMAAVKKRFGGERHTPSEIEWLSDNGSGYTADDTRRFAMAVGMKPSTKQKKLVNDGISGGICAVKKSTNPP